MQPLPDAPPPPEGWVYIEHPTAGRSANPVQRDSLNTWIRGGWTEVPGSPPGAPAVAPPVPVAEQASIPIVKE